MVIRKVIKVSTYLYSDVLKNALNKYADEHKTSLSVLLKDALLQMIESNDFVVSVDRVYDEMSDQGKTALENQRARSLSFVQEMELIDNVDDIVSELRKSDVKINRSLFIQEAIRRYLEPILIREGYLSESVFKSKDNAVKNLKFLRTALGYTSAKSFHANYLKSGTDEYYISYPQYAYMERKSEGNVDRVIDIISDSVGIEKEFFYLDSNEFEEYIGSLFPDLFVSEGEKIIK
ncbi:hypothetical protein [Dehalobacter sp. TeCB1]|uniref:hypothetical protein n=1 Tax=Dehalobacter sp. TeCB1 TaxID=1843715 RepID=UPI00083ADD90|nr:hypothetical protein [Dehalobacter sp. TeCB1]OCZ50862.1 hypothetical protein A7D23_14290 [Dehalobacter sp. TeCB1]